MARVSKSPKKKAGTDAKPFRKRLNYKVILPILVVVLLPFCLALFSPKTAGFIFRISEKVSGILGLGDQKRAPECSPELERIVKDAAYEHGLDWLLIKAVIKVESGFNPKAVSPDGAQGLMQLMPDTAADMKVKDPHDPRENVFAGVKYLAWLIKRYEGDLDMALAAYNAGPKKVSQYGKVPPFKETEAFIERVKDYYDVYQKEAAAARLEILVECGDCDDDLNDPGEPEKSGKLPPQPLVKEEGSE